MSSGRGFAYSDWRFLADAKWDAVFVPRYESKPFKLPDQAIHKAFVEAVKIHVLQQFVAGNYRDVATIDSIFKTIIRFCKGRITELIPAISSEKYLVDLLWMWECSATIQDDSIYGRLDEQRAAIWVRRGRGLRRSIKFLMQQCVLASTTLDLTPNLTKQRYEEIFDELLLAGETLVQYSFASDQTAFYFSETTELVVSSEFLPEILFTDQGLSDRVQHFMQLEKKHAALREQMFGLMFEDDFKKHRPILDQAFKSTFGNTYGEVQEAILLIAFRQGNKQQVLGETRSKVFGTLSKETRISASSLKQILSAFVLSRQDIEKDDQSYFNPRAKYRPFRRGVMEYETDHGLFWSWSVRMAWEAATELFRGLVYKQVPNEWKCKVIDRAIDDLSAEGSKWFENIVRAKLTEYGIRGAAFKAKIGSGVQCVLIPAAVGELDFLGYDERRHLLVLVECKMVQMATDPKMWRRDQSEFLEKKGSYTEKFRRKIEFVRKNSAAIVAALGYEHHSTDSKFFSAAMITLYPSLVSALVTDFPCISVTELFEMMDSSDSWPLKTDTLC